MSQLIFTDSGALIEQYPDIEFDCPICNKHIIVKRDKKGNYYHRPWMFHFTYDHGKDALKYCKEDINLWLHYYTFFEFPFEEDIALEMRLNWFKKVQLKKKE
jgi:hypothetical protein